MRAVISLTAIVLQGLLIEFGHGRSKGGGSEFTFINFGDARYEELEGERSSIIKTVIDGERRVTLECAVSNSQQIQFHWILNDKLIQNTTRRYQEGSNLFISRITRKYDEGDFNCVATNTTSGFVLKSPPVKLNIIWINPQAIVELSTPVAKANIKPGVEVILKCKVDATSKVDFTWFRNGVEIVSSDAVIIRDQRLHILKVNVEDNGSYDCLAKNEAGIAQTAEKFHLTVEYEGVPKIIMPPKDQVVKAHSRVTLQCAFEKNTSVQWFYQDNGPLTNSSRYTVYSNGSITIHEAQTADEGTYKCAGSAPSYRDGPQIYAASLKISYLHSLNNSSLDPPPFVPGHILAYPENSIVEVFCEKPEAYPVSNVWWENSGGVILNKTTKSRNNVFERDSNTLIINGLRQDATGQYSCWAENTAGITNTSFHLSISLRPIIVGHPVDIIVAEGDDAVFKCHFEGSQVPISHVRWLRNSVPISENLEGSESPEFRKRSKMWNHEYNSTLILGMVEFADSGAYACEVTAPGFTPVRSRPAMLNVKESLRFTSPPLDRKLELGSSSRIHCRASGATPPEIQWIKFERNGAIRTQLPEHIQDNNGTLYFQDVRITDKGLYACIAKNSDGFINTTIYVDVIVSPRFLVTPTDPTEAVEGEILMIHCRAEGDPVPTISWDRNSVMNGFDPHRFRILENGSLLITQVLQDDEGTYACTAGNSGGLRREEMNLIVRRDNLMTRTVTITLSVAAGYMILVVGLILWCKYRQVKRKQAYLTELQGGDERETEMKEMTTNRVCNGNGSLKLANVTGKSELNNHKDKDTSLKSDGEATKSSHSSVGPAKISTTASLASHRSHNSQNSERSNNSSFCAISSPRNDLQFVMLLGHGNFGEVFLANAKGIREGEDESLVMVKALQTREEAYLCEFKRELDMYHKLNHENVSRLVRLCREMDPHYMIMEYSDWGDLKQFLLATRKDHPRVPKPPQLTMQQIVRIAKQIALGMEHLSNLRFVHKDLAARNCLISSGLKIQVSNSSLSRDTYSSEYYMYQNQTLPIRWLPYEAVIEDEFSTKSDAYSFGVVCWEIITQASVPFTTLSNDGLIKALQRREICGKYLQMEEAVPKALRRLLSQCWDASPKSRPTFSSIALCLSEIVMDELPK